MNIRRKGRERLPWESGKAWSFLSKRVVQRSVSGITIEGTLGGILTPLLV